jgi:hypothetical protein
VYSVRRLGGVERLTGTALPCPYGWMILDG